MNRPIDAVWVGVDKFVYVPGSKSNNFGFETAHTGRIIEPGLMYTDGGSIPRIAQIFKPFSPWGYGPAYIVHDWVFYGHYCELDANITDRHYEDARRFADVNGDRSRLGTPYEHPVSFHESAQVLAEVIKTMEDQQQIGLQKIPAQFITSAVDSTFASALWESRGQCERLRVTPRHIAMVWVRHNNGFRPVPPTWKLSRWEVAEASKLLAWARHAVRTLRPIKEREKRGTGVVAQVAE
jgi:hypothetical protein